MDFLEFVASRMFHDRCAPDNPRNVQIFMKDTLEKLAALGGTEERYKLRLQGHIELQKHIQLFGKLN